MQNPPLLPKRSSSISGWVLGLLIVLWVLPGFAGEPVTDASITHWVRDALRNDPRIDVTDIRVTTKHGIVSLEGPVTSLAAKQYADLEAKKIHGVASVENNLVLSPMGIPDAAVEQQIRRRLVNSAVIESQGIQVKVVNGTAWLTGMVATWTEGQEAGLLAEEAKGVREVKNEITVDTPTKRNDREIQADVTAALARNVYLTGFPITVTVQNGTVTVRGSVGNTYEKIKAQKIAGRIVGVQDIRNQLQVDESQNRGARKAVPPLTNELVLERVRTELKQNNRIDASDISIQGAYGHITIDGSANSLYEKHLAEQDVRDVVGVGWVTNNLVVHSTHHEDWAVAENVEYAFKTDFALQHEDFSARTKNGVVILSGKTHAWWARLHAKQVASKITGVKEVLNKITLVDVIPYSDYALTKAVGDRLTWNWVTYKFHGRITVAVRNGVATLSGEVDWWSQRKEAGAVVYTTQGIWLVDNQMTVKHYEYPWKEWEYGGNYHSKPPADYHMIYDME